MGLRPSVGDSIPMGHPADISLPRLYVYPQRGLADNPPTPAWGMPLKLAICGFHCFGDAAPMGKEP